MVHPNLLQVVAPPHVTAFGITIVTEYCDSGTLEGKMARQDLTKYELKRFARDLLDGLSYMHEFGCVHRDLKPSNVFLRRLSQELERAHHYLLIADFGLLHFGNICHTMVGTPIFMAPEVWSTQAYDNKVAI